MSNNDLHHQLLGHGYRFLKTFPDGTVAGIMPQIFTCALFVGLTEFRWEQRYCYETCGEAIRALEEWDGLGDPPGLWIKEKPSDRLGPGATA